ncbi:M23 family metallopeptidase [Streptacidiphilus fuscans]|uniref:M23 family metallopeptidase n=1 Tax=Streptacidiphilus fuscans TaxID=2789292 RepID=UPI002E299C48|nr:M23 family metallopeptidase [Streptacidiphilus fuscans]
MTTDTSWYGQETLVLPDHGRPYPEQWAHDPYSSQQLYASYDTCTAYDAYPAYDARSAPTHQPYEAYQAYHQQPYQPHLGYPEYHQAQPEYAAAFADQPTTTVPSVDFADATLVDVPVRHEETLPAADPATTPPVVGGRAAARGARRKATRRRSAVLTIVAPSAAVLGVAGAAAATIGPLHTHHHATTTASAPDAAQAQAKALTSAETRDAAERASRDEARTALQLRAAAAKKAAAEAPRFGLPIAYHTGLSALFGQAGTHWMQLHTGIDFPVPVGTPVHAVTGGSVSTEWNPFYGNMSKVTASDGTITWYCHLSAYRLHSGPVKVGDVIAYSGDTGNSTGPHLHFEVHPSGGPAVDPLPWLLARGLDPR